MGDLGSTRVPPEYKTEKLTGQGKNGSLGEYHSLLKPDLAEVSGSPLAGKTLDKTVYAQGLILALTKVLCCHSVMTGRRGGPPSGKDCSPHRGSVKLDKQIKLESGTISSKQFDSFSSVAKGEQMQLSQCHVGMTVT